MSLGTALNAATSGLSITARGTQIVADNIANAGTDGYGVRTLTQSSRSVGGAGSGVIATGVQREANPVLLGAARSAKAVQGAASVATRFWAQLEQSLGESGTPGALLTRISDLDSALSMAIVAPESRALLTQAAQAASDVTRAFHQTQQTINEARDQADMGVARDVDALNDLLSQVARLNADIQREAISGGSPNALMDQRQLLTDQVAQILPVTEISRGFGRVMLLGADGTVLVDQQAATFGFQRSPQPQAGDTVHTGGVARIMQGNREMGHEHPLFGQGRLSAALAVRDEHAPRAQGELDRIAIDLVTRFASPTADPTLPATTFGVFTDPLAAAPPASPLGLGGRIALSPLIEPNDPATLWRLRDGLGAPAPGPVGSSTILTSLRDSLRASTATGDPGQPARDVYGHATEFASMVSTNRLLAEGAETQAGTRFAMLHEQVLAKGVDSDAQLQKLLVLEQNYAANARVISTIDMMMRTLLEI